MTSSTQQLAGRKVLFATVSGDGHINPLTGLAKYLQDAGCDVRWYASKHYTPKFQQLSIYHYPLKRAKDINCFNVEEMLPERAGITGRLNRINYDMINIFTLPATKYFEDIKDIYVTFPFDIMIVDVMFTAGPIVREKLCVPVIAVGTIPLAEASRDLPPYGMGMTPSSGPVGRIKQAILRFMSNKVLLKKSFQVYEDIFRRYGIANKGITTLDSIVKNSDLLLQIGSPGLEYHRSDIGRNVRFIGPLLPYATQKGCAWFDDRLKQYKKSVVVTQGKAEKNVTKLIIPTLEAFRDTDVLTIAITGGSQTEALRAKYPYRNIIIEDHIPFDDIMPYASAFISNGSYGDVLSSLQHELPIIAAGVHDNKNEICARIGYLRYGINLHTETPTADQLIEAFEDILDTDIYKKNIHRLNEEFKQYDPIPLSAAYVAEMLKNASV